MNGYGAGLIFLKGPGSEISKAIMHYVYLIRSEANDQLYIGYTTNIKRRILEHNRGENQSTKHYKPWKLIFAEIYIEEMDAKRREQYLKTNQGSRLLKRMLKEYFYRHP